MGFAVLLLTFQNYVTKFVILFYFTRASLWYPSCSQGCMTVTARHIQCFHYTTQKPRLSSSDWLPPSGRALPSQVCPFSTFHTEAGALRSPDAESLSSSEELPLRPLPILKLGHLSTVKFYKPFLATSYLLEIVFQFYIVFVFEEQKCFF